MLTVLIANPKGGCGKTTIATNLAAAFANNGLATTIADVDKQKSSLGWLETRPDTAAPIKGVDWGGDVGKVGKKTARLVIDSPAALSIKETKDYVRLADVVVVPILPSAFDQKTTAAFLEELNLLKPVRKERKAVALIRNRIRGRSRAAARLDRFLIDRDLNGVTRLPDRALYPELADRGLSLFDLKDQTSEPLRQDWWPLLRFIENAAA